MQDPAPRVSLRELLGPSAEEVRARRAWERVWKFVVGPALILGTIYWLILSAASLWLTLRAVALIQATSAAGVPFIEVWRAYGLEPLSAFLPAVGKCIACGIGFGLGIDLWDTGTGIVLWCRDDLSGWWAAHVSARPPVANVTKAMLASTIAAAFGGGLACTVWLGMAPDRGVPWKLLEVVFVTGSVPAAVLLLFRARSSAEVAHRGWALAAIGTLMAAAALPGYNSRILQSSGWPPDSFDAALNQILGMGWLLVLLGFCGFCIFRYFAQAAPEVFGYSRNVVLVAPVAARRA